MFGQKNDVIAAFAQRRNRERHGGDAEIQIFAKEFFFGEFSQIAVGGDDDADVDVDGLRAADALEAALFEYAQEFGLDGQRQFADFVEEERAAVGQFHFADFARAGTGEGAAFVAEEFVFDQAFGNGGAIQRDEGLLAARGKMMDGAREEFFAGAAFAEQQHGGIGGGDALDLLADFADGSVFADDARKAVARGIFFAEDEIFAQQFLLAGGAVDEKFQVIEIDGFLEKIEGAFFHGGDGFFDGAECGEQNDRNGGVGLLGFAQHVEAGSAGHFQVGEDQQIAAGANFLNGGGAVGGFVDCIAGALQCFAQHGAKFSFVFDEEKRFHRVFLAWIAEEAGGGARECAEKSRCG